MFRKFERIVALRYLRPRRKEGFVSVISGFSLLGIILGVGTLIVVMAVMNGVRLELVNRVLGLNGHLSVYGDRGSLSVDTDLDERIAAVPGVVQTFRTVEGQALVSANGVAAGAAVRGVRPEDFLNRASIAAGLRQAPGVPFEGADRIAIGHRMAERFGLRLGDQLTLLAPQATETAFGAMPRMRAFTVAALFDVGMYEFDSAVIFMPMEAAQVFFQMRERFTSLDIFVADPTDPAQYRLAIYRALEPGELLWDWQQANASFFNAIEVQRNVLFLILALIILVAAFNIISGLVMLVKDKGRQIAIMRTMGATRGTILRIFFLTGAWIGIAGTVIGVGLGVAFAANIDEIRQGLENLTGTDLFAAEIYFLSQLPAVIDWREVAAVSVMSLGLSFLATIYPAWRAARLDPVEALRYE